MGKMTGPYKEEFPVSSRVRIINRDRLDRCKASWVYHHPLTLEQLSYAGTEAVVADVSFYHGGGELYRLTGIPGISDTTARALIERFGTVEQLLAAGPERWADVDGVGPVRAHALATALLG